jgi:hypothetical protein
VPATAPGPSTEIHRSIPQKELRGTQSLAEIPADAHALKLPPTSVRLPQPSLPPKRARRATAQAFALMLLPYFLSYVTYRHNHLETWEHDGKSYIMFPNNDAMLAKLFVPLLWLDHAIAGISHRIGEHPKPPPIDSGIYLRIN